MSCHPKIEQLSCIFKKMSLIAFLLLSMYLSPVSHLLFYVSCLLYHVSCIMPTVSCILSHVYCLTSSASCLLSHVFCFLSHVSVSCLLSPPSSRDSFPHLLSHVSCLTSPVLSPVSHLLSLVLSLLFHVSCLTSPVSHLMSPVSSPLYHIFCLTSPVSCLTSPVAYLLLHISCLTWPPLSTVSFSLLKCRFIVFYSIVFFNRPRSDILLRLLCKIWFENGAIFVSRHCPRAILFTFSRHRNVRPLFLVRAI